MANLYATPTNVREKLGNTLIELLNLPNSSNDAVVAAANQLMAGESISIPVTATEETAARRLYRACIAANATVDTGLRGTYSLPLRTHTGGTDPNDPEFYPQIIAAAANIVKWELLAARKGIRTEDDRTEYEDALRFLGVDNSASGAAASIVGVDITGNGTAETPRGASVVQIGRSDKTAERRERMGNADWTDRF